MLNLLTQLCSLSGIGGWEDEVSLQIKKHAAPYADDIQVDAMGTLIIKKRGERPAPGHLMLCAHMDEVGLIVRSITGEGYLKFECVGGIDTRVLIGKKVLVGSNAIPGVIGIKAYHLVGEEEEKTTPKLKDLYIDIGAEDKDGAAALVELGDPCIFDTRCEPFGDGLFKAKALDDRLGCALLLKLMERKLAMDVTFVFTTQEEVGMRGAFGAAFTLKPKVALVVECTTAADLPGVEEARRVCALGKGPVIPFMDQGFVADRGLYACLCQLADAMHIPWQTKSTVSGGNDAGAIQRTASGTRVAVVSAPVRYLHAPCSVGCIQDFDYMLELLDGFVRKTAAEL